MTGSLLLVISLLLLVVAIKVKAIRKAVGLTLVIIGAIVSFTGIGMLFGIPMILMGGVLLFW